MEMDSDKKVTFHPDPGSHGDPASAGSVCSKPRSVQEWLEQNDTRASAGLEIAKINANIGKDCFDAYDCFLRTQVFVDVDSNLIKNLESRKRKEIESFRNYDAIYNIEKMIHQTRTAFHDARRQKKAMEKILAGYDEHDRTITNVTTEHIDSGEMEPPSETIELNIKSALDELSDLNLKPLNDEPIVVTQSERVNSDGSMKPVTNFAGSKGPKWVAMYQPPYKQLYSRSTAKKQKKKNFRTTEPLPRAKGVVRAYDLIENDLNSESVLPVRFHLKARNGSFLVK